MQRENRRFVTGPLMPLSLLAFFFAVSLGLYFLLRPAVDGRVFFYPDNSGSYLRAERRPVPQKPSLAEELEVFLGELFLGPVTFGFSPVVPGGTAIRHVAVMGDTAYIDLGRGMLSTDNQLSVSFDEALENITYNIRRNFPGIRQIVFSIEGSQVHAPFFGGA